MAKLSKEELLSKVNESELSEDAKISFMEDISDSITEPDTSELDSVKAELERVTAELEDLKIRYKERFLNNDVEVKVIVDEEEPIMEEEEVIDVKDIFTDEEKKEEE